MTELTFNVCRVDDAEGIRDYVTLIPIEQAFSRGLVPKAIVGVLSRPLADEEAITLELFAPNQVFVEFLHEVIARRGPSSPGLVAEAERQGDGWAYIIDGRTRSPEGPVPPEDIIGAFEVRGGSLVPGSYCANPNHRLLSAHGFFRLSPDMQEALAEELANRA
jgi:hypothetical protein